jgi:xanthine dehydrogenase accessory factor
MKEILPDIERWRARGDRIALATVIATRRSAPRPVGSKLAISDNGEMAGSVSGGCVENEVYGQACEILDGAPP